MTIEAPALLHDGLSAMPHQAWARLTPIALLILRRDAPPLEWPLATLRQVDRLPHELRVAPQSSAQRLVVQDPSLITALDAAMAPARSAARGRGIRRALAMALAVPLLGATLWFGWPPLADALARAMPQSWEVPVGTAVVSAIAEGRARCTAPEGTAALQRLAERLAAAGGLTEVPRVQVLDGPEINALAAPGGQVLVFRGLVDQAESAEEVAGVLAHEFGHVRHRHGFRAVVRASGVGIFVSILMGGSDLGTVAVALLTLSYTRGFEEEADAYAATLLREMGIGAEGLARFFARMERLAPGGQGLWAYLRTHPHSGERAERLRRGAAPAVKSPAMPLADWAALRRVCAQSDQPRMQQ